MRFNLLTAAVVALAADGAVASSWFGKAAYNKWHETELERWLSDHNVPHPAPADRKDLLDAVKSNWESNVVSPYNSWDTNQLQKYLSSQGKQAQKGAEQNKDSLLKQVQQSWSQTADQASDSYNSVQDWIFDSWTDSQIKSYLDYNKIPNPTPRTRDSLLQSARSNFQSAADKVGETAAYPGDWLYKSWSDSDLKEWLDARGVPVPQPSSRDKLIASVRRNSRVSGNKANSVLSSVSASAASASASLTDELLSSWSESQLKQWADENGVKVPQGSKKNELLALVRKNRSRATASITSGYGAATTSAGNAFAEATNDLYSQGKQWYDWALAQVGAGSDEVKASISSVSSVASSYAASVSGVADKSASYASSKAAKTSGDGVAAANSARASVSRSASSVSKSASSASSVASRSAKSATASAKNEL